MKFKTIIVPIIHCISFLLLLGSLILLITDNATLSINGFGVDSAGRVYVGRIYKIEIFEDGQRISQIDIPHYRNWSIEISQDDSIILSNGSVVYVMGLSGEVMSQMEDPGGERYREARDKRSIIGGDGQEYRLRNSFGKTIIVDAKGEPVYEGAILDQVVQLSFYLSIAGLLVSIPFIRSIVKERIDGNS